MAVNALTIHQLSTILNSIVSQATGKNILTPTNTAEFVSVANMGLLAGYDPLLNAISQVLSYTIFSVRPYTAKFRGLQQNALRFGNHVRKLSIADKDFTDDQRQMLTDGQSIDMYKVNKPVIVQTNYYGQNVYQKDLTIFRDQLDVAFRSPDEFGRFINMVMQNASDLLEQARETTARMTLANFMGGKIAGDSGNVIHAVTLYNEYAGTELTSETVKAPANFIPFIKWLCGHLKTVAGMMTERSVKYHINVTGKEISRHTPPNRLKMYLYTPIINQIDSSVLSDIYNDRYLKLADHEQVNFWQSIDTTDSINITPAYIDNTGALVVAKTAVSQDNILGVMFDDEAIGITNINQWSATTPLNAAGGYWNIFYHETHRYYNDFMENGVVIVLD